MIDSDKQIAKLRASNAGSAKNDSEPHTLVMVVHDDTEQDEQLQYKIYVSGILTNYFR